MDKINNFYKLQTEEIKKKISQFDVSNFSPHF